MSLWVLPILKTVVMVPALTLPKATAALIIATTIHVALLQRGPIMSMCFRVFFIPWGIRCESWEGGYKVSWVTGTVLCQQSHSSFVLNQLLSFPLGSVCPSTLLCPSCQFSFQAQIFWNPSINTAGTQAATKHMLLLGYLPKCLHSMFEELSLLQETQGKKSVQFLILHPFYLV